MEDLRKVDEEFDQLESEIETLKIRKRNLVKKLQQSNKVSHFFHLNLFSFRTFFIKISLKIIQES